MAASISPPVSAYVARLRRSSLVTTCVTWLRTTAAHPWTRACVRVLRYAFALLTGEPYDDERVAFSKPRLMVNDTYRDRLLAPEIAALVDLSDALQLSIAQRKAFFRCFLHLDFMRRSGVSGAELLRYCGLRETPAARVLLPSDGAFDVAASAHRSDEFHTQRWDVTQLLTLMFSLCTMHPMMLIDVCIREICALATTEESSDEQDVKVGGVLCREIRTCLEFCYGVPSPMETQLSDFLCRVYSSDAASFTEIHGVASLSDAITLFPVLVFPCLWMQTVIRRRVLGEATWSILRTRRLELERMGLHTMFASADEIVEVANKYTTKVPVRWRLPTLGVDDSTRYSLSIKPETTKSNAGNAQHSLRLTPRRVLPVELPKPISSTNVCQEISSLSAFKSINEAWRVTADSVLATVHVWQEIASDENLELRNAVELFRVVRLSIEQKTLRSESVERVKRWLIQQYGYQFTTEVLSKSSLRDTGGELVATTSVRKQRRRAEVRYQKADSGIPLAEDKGTYWKEYTDPLSKHVFYYNVRTGESRWEMPVTFVQKRPKRRRERKTIESPAKRDVL